MSRPTGFRTSLPHLRPPHPHLQSLVSAMFLPWQSLCTEAAVSAQRTRTVLPSETPHNFSQLDLATSAPIQSNSGSRCHHRWTPTRTSKQHHLMGQSEVLAHSVGGGGVPPFLLSRRSLRQGSEADLRETLKHPRRWFSTCTGCCGDRNKPGLPPDAWRSWFSGTQPHTSAS